MIRNCPRCKKVFHFIHSPICDDCVKEEADIFERVRDHLKEHPGLTVIQLSDQTNVSSKKILKYIKDGKLELASGEIRCEKCGCNVPTGRYCEECIEMMAKKAMLAVQEGRDDATAKGQKMFMDRSRRGK